MAAKLEPTRTPGIYRRGSRYVVRYTDGDGHARQESARTLDDARKLKAARMAAVASGEHHPASHVKFRDYALEWVDRYQGRGGRGFRETTRNDYRRDLNRYILPYFDGKIRRKVDQVKPRDVANFVAWLCDEAEQGKLKATEARKRKAARAEVDPNSIPLVVKPTYLADKTIRRIIAPLRSCFSSALAEGVVSQNPVAGVGLPARDEQRAIDLGKDTDEERVKALDKSEVVRFLTACRDLFGNDSEDEAVKWAGRKWELFFRLLDNTGIRWSEAVELRWKDLDLESVDPELRVRRAFTSRSSKPGPPKSKYSRREMPLPASLAADLSDYRRKGTDWFGPDELVFPDSEGNHLRHENVRRRVLGPAAKAARLDGIGFHTFRHTCATRLFIEGRNPVQVQRWLGHHSAAFTLSTYVHLLNNDLGGPLNEREGVTGVSREATDTARNDTQSEAVISH